MPLSDFLAWARQGVWVWRFVSARDCWKALFWPFASALIDGVSDSKRDKHTLIPQAERDHRADVCLVVGLAYFSEMRDGVRQATNLGSVFDR